MYLGSIDVCIIGGEFDGRDFQLVDDVANGVGNKENPF